MVGSSLFAFIIAFFVNKEYTNKTILFYRLLNYNSVKFFLNKIFVLIVESVLLVMVLLAIVSAIYQDFSLFPLMLFLLTMVVAQYIIIIGLISFLSNNILLSIGLSILYWILSVVLVSSSESLSYVAIFDASNTLYSHVDHVFTTGHNFISSSNSVLIVSYIGCLLVLSIVISMLTNRRWLKLGID